MRKRHVNFDNLRGLAIIAVVMIHVTAPRAGDGYTRSVILNQVARFGVPVFVFLSGWGLTIANSYEKAANYFDFLRKRLSKLLPAYVTWNLIYLLYSFFVQGERMTLGEAFKGLLYGTNFPHLYFVPLIVLFYLAYPFLRKIGKSHLGLSLSLILNLYSLIATWGVTFEGFTRNHNPLNWLFYFVFGIWIAEYYEKIKDKLNLYWIMVVGFFSLMIVILEPLEITEETLLTQTRISVVFYSTMVILFIIQLPKINNELEKILQLMSDYSFPTYLSHYLFIRLYREWLPALPSLIMLIIVLISSVGLIKLQEAVRHKIE